MELKDYLRIARQRWMAIAVVTLLAIAAAEFVKVFEASGSLGG